MLNTFPALCCICLRIIGGCHEWFRTMQATHLVFWGVVCQQSHAGFRNVNRLGSSQILHPLDLGLESFSQILQKKNNLQWGNFLLIAFSFWFLWVNSLTNWCFASDRSLMSSLNPLWILWNVALWVKRKKRSLVYSTWVTLWLSSIRLMPSKHARNW